MTLAEIQSKIYALTSTDSASYPNATMLIDLNIWQHKIASMIIDSQDGGDYDDINYTDYPQLTTPLTTNRDYSIPQTEGVINIKTVSISYDGVNWVRAIPFDSGATGLPAVPASATTGNTVLDQSFSYAEPRYDPKYNSVFIYPKATQAQVDAGGQIFIEWSRDAKPFTLSDLTTGTLIPSFDTAFHAMLAYGCALEYSISTELDNQKEIKAELDNYELRLRRQYGSKNRDAVIDIRDANINYA